ncbi:MAG TPA: PilZ domain-containing protein [Gemmataceae bacterium]|nr:PilZ domain-containing protein [Gemmataceae bacterium]
MTRRYLPRPGVTINFRAGTLGLGPDLAVSVIDLSEDGLCLRSKAAVSPGAEAEVSVARAGWGRPLKLLCEVRWCEEDEQGKFLVGVRYRKRMLHRDLSELVRMS